MKKIEELTMEEINEIFGVILDSKLQDRLMNNTKSSKSWMLDFVYDSRLRLQLEKFAEVKQMDLELKNKEQLTYKTKKI